LFFNINRRLIHAHLLFNLFMAFASNETFLSQSEDVLLAICNLSEISPKASRQASYDKPKPIFSFKISWKAGKIS